jgi:mono/diheme cytochrome c family protein
MRNSSVWISGGLVLAFLAVAGVVQAAKPAQNQEAKPPKDMEALYLKNCSICHGDKGNGDTRARGDMYPQPRNFTTVEAAMELTRERMIHSVTEGRPGTAMMAHKGRLSKEEIAGLVDYIRANFMRLPPSDTGKVPAAVSLGEKVYTQNCAVCHGDKGNTAFWAQSGLNPPPRDFTSPLAQNTLTRDRMIHSVTHGRPGTGMMPFNKRLTKEQIASVVAFIRFKFMGLDPEKDTGETPLAQLKPEAKAEPKSAHSAMGGIPGVDTPLASARPAAPAPQDPHQMPHPGTVAAKPAAAPAAAGMPQGHSIDVDMSLPVPNGLKGDITWARQFYMKNCFTCHGVKGDGNGPRAYFNKPRPRNFTSENSRRILNRPRIFNSITKGRVGTVMPAWGKVLDEQQIAGLTEFVFQTFVQPESGKEKDKKKASS